MIKTDAATDGLGYADVGVSTKRDEATIISDLVGAYRQEADVFGNTHFDIAYLGEYNGDYNFRIYRG